MSGTEKTQPQGLKPLFLRAAYGTAKAVPFRKRYPELFMRWLVVPPRRGQRGRALALGLLFLLATLAPVRFGHAQAKPAKPVPEKTPALAQPAPEAPQQTKPRADVARFRARVEAVLAEARADKGHWGVLVADAATGEVLYALNPQRYFTPASNTKLFTTALALATLGPDYRFRTTIETRGTVDQEGRLRGDLVLVGRGDPNLSNRKFPFAKEVEREGPPERVLAELADAVVARGIKQIEGEVIADDSYFAAERYPSGWAIDDMLWGYGAPVSALAVNDNVIFLELRPGERERDPAGYSVEPWADFYKIQNEITTGAVGSEQKLEVSREPGTRLIVLRGSMPTNARPHLLAIAVEEPAEHAARLLKRLLEARGICVYGEARARHSSPAEPRDLSRVQPRDSSSAGPTILAEHTSLPLIEDLHLANKVSQNLHAELLLRTAAREKAGALTLEAALKFAGEFFQSIGIAEGDVLLWDGSGLSRRNLVTPQAVLRLLQYAAAQPWGEVFRSTLAIAGEDGTLAERMKNTPAAGRIQAKTGSLDHVNSLSGYAATARGAKLVFSIFGNNHNLRGRDSTAVADAICIAMIEELGAPSRDLGTPSPDTSPPPAKEKPR